MRFVRFDGDRLGLLADDGGLIDLTDRLGLSSAEPLVEYIEGDYDASEYVEADFDRDRTASSGETRASWKEDITEEDIEEAANQEDVKASDLMDVENPGWDLEGIGVVDRDGEEVHDVKRSGVQYVQIDDASHLDPPIENPPDRPEPRFANASVTQFG
jgi:hypothetical protein